MAKTDEELMMDYQKGDLKAFEALYQRSASKLYGYLSKKMNDPGRVDDVFQKVFLKFHNSRHSYDSKYKFEQWLFVIARSVFLDDVKQLKKQEGLHREIQTLSLIETAPTNSDLERPKLTGLAKDQKQIVELRLFDELSYQEISKRLNQSEISIRKAFSRAMKKLRGQYGS